MLNIHWPYDPFISRFTQEKMKVYVYTRTCAELFKTVLLVTIRN